MFHLRYGEMTLTLQDVTVLLGLSIDGQAVTSTGVCNRIALYEWSFELAPPPSELKGE
jgi:hypothetical protein